MKKKKKKKFCIQPYSVQKFCFQVFHFGKENLGAKRKDKWMNGNAFWKTNNKVYGCLNAALGALTNWVEKTKENICEQSLHIRKCVIQFASLLADLGGVVNSQWDL